MDALGSIIKATNLYLLKKQEQQQQRQQQQQQQPQANGGARQGEGAASAVAAPQPLLLRKGAAYVTRILSVFGVVPVAADGVGFGGGGAGAAAGGSGEGDKGAAYLDAFSAFRDEVRGLAKAKAPHSDVLAACDAVRDGACVDLGVRLEDRPDGKALWKLDDPAALRAERDERAAAAAEAARKKVSNALAAKQRDLEKFEKLAAMPSPQ
ncbi:hypothetical protein MNEG_16712, partial [Monoraphidium neglectum]